MRKAIFAIQLVPHYDVHLVAMDAQEASILISLVEMAGECAGVTFGDWMIANRGHEQRLERMLEHLREWADDDDEDGVE